MRYTFSFSFLFCFAVTLTAQELADSTPLCSTTVSLITYTKQPSDTRLYFVCVHEDESTGTEAAKKVIDNNGGVFTYLHHAQTRTVSFTCGASVYTFDPNRIFTDSGRRKTLEKLSHWNAYGDSIVKGFAASLLKKMKEAEHIVALHNNTNANYSISSYLNGGSEYGNAAKIYINKKEDADDFIFTTDENIFRACKKLKLNVALQDNVHCFDDGSLSVYCGRRNISYTNIEAEHGHLQKQMEMILALKKITDSLH